MNLFGKTIHPRIVVRKALRRLFKAVFFPADFLFCAWRRFPYRFDTRLLGYPCVRNRGTIRVGRNVVLCSRQGGNTIGVQQAVRLTVSRGGRLSIGDGTGISGSSIYAAREISIGARVRIGSGCLVMDNDAHPLDPVDRDAGRPPATAPVRIEDDAFVGARSIVLKGVTIGRAAVVGAGSVVTKDVSPFTIVAGNPARAIGSVPG
jgi:acetyltransferase-like isoleucine patch superfamily enzyme